MDVDCAKRNLATQSKLIIIWLVSVVFITACSSPYVKQKDSAPKKPPTRVDRAQKVIPKLEPKSKYGNPPSYVVFGKRYHVMPSSKGYVEQGIASWYGTKFHGRRTSSGETYDMYAMTAAHKTLPLPTYARVTNLKNGRSMIVRINDRGPFHQNRIIDLSYSAATKLGIVTLGTGLVEVRAIDPRKPPKKAKVKPIVKENIVDVAAEPSTTKAIDVEITDHFPSAEEVENKIGIYVQLGAFRSAENAQKLRVNFSAHNLGSVKVKEFSHEGLPLYKVWIGPLDDVQQADRTVEKINELGHQDYKIVFESEPKPL